MPSFIKFSRTDHIHHGWRLTTCVCYAFFLTSRGISCSRGPAAGAISGVCIDRLKGQKTNNYQRPLDGHTAAAAAAAAVVTTTDTTFVSIVLFCTQQQLPPPMVLAKNNTRWHQDFETACSIHCSERD